MIIDKKNEKHLIAEEGKVLARVNNLDDTYCEIFLGLYNHDGIIRLDTKDDFIEIPIENNDEQKINE